MVDTVNGTMITPNTAVNFSNLTLTGGLVTSNVSLTPGTTVQTGIFAPTANTLALVANGISAVTVDVTGVMASQYNVQTSTSMLATNMIGNTSVVTKGTLSYQLGNQLVSVKAMTYYWGQIF